jgi:hypothetical protein
MGRMLVLAVLLTALATAAGCGDDASSAGSPPNAPLRTCRDRGGGGRITPNPKRDRIIGPVALYRFYENYDAARTTRPVGGRSASTELLALVDAGSKVTLAVPKSERNFLKLMFWRPAERYAVALQACRRVPRTMWKSECGFKTYTACDWINTPFDGGLDLQFTRARGKECSARLEVWVRGRAKPFRELLLPRGGHGCPVRNSKGSGSTKVRAQDARLARGQKDVRLLALPKVGRVLVSCDAGGRPSAALVASRLLPTADVVVGDQATTLQPGRRFSPPPPTGSAQVQTWRIAPFAAADVRVTTIWVALRRLAPGDVHACAASAQALVTKQGGPSGS